MNCRQVYVETFGCQMNDRDSECMLALLAKEGYRRTTALSEADLILFNTCSIREKAEVKVYARLGDLKRLKGQRGDAIILGVAGCLAQQEGKRLLERAEHLDLVLGTGQIRRLPELLEQIRGERTRLCATSLDGLKGPAGDGFLRPLPQGKVSELLTIMEGCDNFCTYCVVPYVRCREKSRDPEDILNEVKELVESGTKEVTLIGQNVNSYGKKNGQATDFFGLLQCLEEITGLERVRFTTSHPRDLSEGLVRGFGSLPKLCAHIHLPVQSGSNQVLSWMGRGYTKEGYLRKVEELRSVCPTIAITSDIIVGFPGEKEEDFQDTMALLEKVQFDNIFSFKFSPRPGTKAGQMVDDVPAPVKAQRLIAVQRRQKEISLKKNQGLEGKVMEILVEGQSKKNPHELFGRTRCNRVVNFPGPSELLGRLVPVRIVAGLPNCLRGYLC